MTRLALSRVRHHLTEATALATITLLTAAPAHASGSSMPWEAPLQSILESILQATALSNVVDKVITTLVVFGLVRTLPIRFRAPFPRAENVATA